MMYKLPLPFFAIVVISMSCNFLHPYHVSICDIEQKEKNKALEITWHIFTDDLEEALNKRTTEKLDLERNTHKHLADSLIQSYLLEKFQIITDKKKRQWKYLGYECNNRGTLIYLESENVPKFKVTDIRCTLLFEIFDDQTNLIHVKCRGILKSMRLTSGASSGQLIFEN